MKPLIDSDVCRYEVGFASEVAWQQPGYPPFDFVAHMLDERIRNICAVVGATEAPTLYLTGKSNFRFDIAKRTPYKVRKNNKPWHFKNITAYMQVMYDTIVSDGMEADDIMAIHQTLGESLYRNRHEGENVDERKEVVRTIICTRDKDLRAVPGWHYGWELGNQPSFGPMEVTGFGEVKLSSDRKSIKGFGEKFFWSQCLTGDRVDSIPGVDGMGPVGAFEIIDKPTTTQEAFEAVLGAYRAVYGDVAEVELLEQGRLLHMTRELHEDGSPVLWELPIGTT